MSFYAITLAFVLLSTLALGENNDKCPPPPTPGPLPSKGSKPNIILILTDDQDLQLGGLDPMPKLKSLIGDHGASASNWMVHTPVCCPSRSELLTSRYFHNIKVSTSSVPNCMYANTSPDGPFNSWLFSPHLKQAGYNIGLFGKYLNTDVPLCPPPGIDEWLANNGGNYLNPTFNYNGKTHTFNETEYGGYSTSVIGNISLNWIEQMGKSERPFFAYIAPKAPHIQDGAGWPKTIPAPWYNETFEGVKAPRTPNYNRSCPDHHWLIAQQPPITQKQASEADALYRTRWQSLLSVDDLIEQLVGKLSDLDLLNNTYILYTSDHGYRFGQFRMPQGKWNVYENDLRIPFLIRGPGILQNSSFANLGSNVDIMATVLGLAGVDTPESMDGKSLVPFVVKNASEPVPQAIKQHIEKNRNTVWRKSLLIEYYGLGNVERYEHLEDTFNNTFRAIRSIDPKYGNVVLAEFTDIRTNFNFTSPGNFYEFFDLAKDPFQLYNTYNSTPPSIISSLHTQLLQLFSCQGTTCN